MKKQVQKIKENKGFSMIELIIVVAIMAILVGIIGAALIPYMEKSRASKDKSLMDSLYTAYGTVLSETEGDTKPGLWSEEVLQYVNATDQTDFMKKFKSKQFSKGTISLVTKTGDDKYYGIVLKTTGYQDVIIDTTGVESKTGIKSGSSSSGK